MPWVEYENWIALTIQVVRDAAGAAWDAETEVAWMRLKALLQDARVGWDRAMPGHVLGLE